MKHALVLLATAAAVVALTACTEQPQTINSGNRPDTPAFQGTGMPFSAPGWKQGDKVSWEQQLRTRVQMGQNDYAKVN
jgi:hypothetical protein